MLGSRGFQTLSAKLNSIILSVRYDFFYLGKRKPVIIPFQKDMNLEILTSNKGKGRYFVFLKKVKLFWLHFFFNLKNIFLKLIW